MKNPQVIAHRGGRQWAPENTMAAFRKSLAFGAWGIELDVHRCASGELVVIHDEELSRTTNGVGLVKDATYAELKRLSAGKWYAPEFEGERIPLLSEVLELLAGKCMLNIELKNTPVDYPGFEDDLIEAIANYPKPDTLIISSFDNQLMQRLHRKAPQLNICLLGAALFIDIGEYAAKMGAKWFHPALDCLTAAHVAEAHAAGLKVNAWTANTRREWDDAIKFNVDGIITDDPEGLKTYLARQAGACAAT